MTHVLYPPVVGIRFGMRNFDDYLGPDPNYQRKGFLILQEALSLAFIDTHKPLGTFPNIYMQRHPRPSWKRREVYSSEAMIFNVVLFMFLSYILLFIGVIKLTTYEKESHIKQTLETAGVSNWMLWISYFIRGLVLFLFCFSVLLFALNVPSNGSLVEFSDNLLIFLFFVCFSSASITLAFLISILNTSTVTAATLGAMLWFLSFLPFYQLKEDIFGTVISFMFAPLCFFHGFDIIFAFEMTEEGLHWSNLWKYPTPKHHFCFGHVLLSLSGCAISYLVLTLYIEQFRSGAPIMGKVRSLWKKLFGSRNSECDNVSYYEDIIQEQPPSNLPLIVKMINLRKMYSKSFIALDNLSLEMYEDQITVLLGPNGAGKTTTANIIAGILKPTRGALRINKPNVRKLLGENQTFLGYCPQTNILFGELTVEEHIYCFSRIKGFNSIDSIEEADKYISMLQLGDKANTAASFLTEGMKRRLSIALALCARSRLVVLDEVTAGADPISKRTIWNMLNAEKRGRCILITTHLIDEAEILADRIAIVCEGALKCSGSSTFLKERFAQGYRLVIIKGTDCNTARICDVMRRYIKDITVTSDVGTQLCFMVDKENDAVIEPMLQNLEENRDHLGVQSFRISMPTLEDVFMKTAVGHQSVPFDQVPQIHVNYLTGRKLCYNKIFALLLKKFLLLKKAWILITMQAVFVLSLIAFSELSIYQKQTFDMPPLEIELKQYNDPVVVIHGENTYKKFYKQIVAESRGKIIDAQDISETIFEHMRKDRSRVLHQYPVGASFLNDSLIAWYNSFPFHSAPLALNLVINAVARQHLSNSYSIDIINHPLRLNNLQKALRTDTMTYDTLQYLVVFFSSIFIIFCIREANTKSMLQQFVSGISPRTYWIITFLCDIAVFMLLVISILILIQRFPDRYNTNFLNLSSLFLILMCYGFASLNLGYLLHIVFNRSSTGYVAKILLGILGIMFATILRYVDKIVSLSEWVFVTFCFIPSFCLTFALDGLNRFQDIEKACKMLYDSCVKYEDREKCINLVAEILGERDICHRSYFTMEKHGILLFLVTQLGFGLFFAAINLTLHTPLLARCVNKLNKEKFRPIRNEDDDVVREREWIRAANIKDVKERTIVLKDVCKIYKRSIALNRVSLAICPRECFGLMGPHGSGKTTLFKIITGTTYAYSGEVLIAGMDLSTNMGRIRNMTTYCPDTDSLFRNLTGEQNLTIHALIRGVPYKTIEEMAQVIAQKLDFSRHLKRKVRHYSGGNKRKLSAAIALLGNAKLILLDEPATGIDVGASKRLWAAICHERDKGSTILLSSHSVEECETICDRIGMLVKGKVVCIGSVERLTTKFTKGYILTIRFKKAKRGEEEKKEERDKKLLKFLKDKVPSAVLLQSFSETYAFQIPQDSAMQWIQIFTMIDNKKTFLNIEDFTLTQSSLEQVFLSVS